MDKAKKMGIVGVYSSRYYAWQHLGSFIVL